jgi:hypothetical protein
LQDVAMRVKRDREKNVVIAALQREYNELKRVRDAVLLEYNRAYVAHYGGHAPRVEGGQRIIQELLERSDDLRDQMREKRTLINGVRWPPRELHGVVEEEEKEEKKKFIRRCTRDGCQGFLSTAWKCGLCEWFSCATCFMVKGQTHDVEHECKKEDVETAELIRKDCKPCPKCGEFIQKSSGCDQMFCISCQTPFSWNTGKVVTSGPIHNPHYYEWLKRTGGNVPRNPTDVPCGGFPGAWELIRFPRGMKKDIANMFYEFHRICMELQDISTRNFRSHMDQTTVNDINIKFLLGDIDEKKWGRLLATNEKKRKRDGEIQEVLGAFRMVAVELINRVQQFTDGPIRSFTDLPAPKAEDFIIDLNRQIQELVKMINDALGGVSLSYSYSVPYIASTPGKTDRFMFYAIRYKNFSMEIKKKRPATKSKEESDSDESIVSDPPSDHTPEETEQLQNAMWQSLTHNNGL